MFTLFLSLFLIANTSSSKLIHPAPLVQNLKCNMWVKHRNHSKSVFITVWAYVILLFVVIVHLSYELERKQGYKVCQYYLLSLGIVIKDQYESRIHMSDFGLEDVILSLCEVSLCVLEYSAWLLSQLSLFNYLFIKKPLCDVALFHVETLLMTKILPCETLEFFFFFRTQSQERKRKIKLN